MTSLMRLFFLVGLTLVAAAMGCVDTTDVSTEPGGISTGEQTSLGALSDEVFAQGPDVNVCDLLPEDGPCSLACDREALIDQYVPPGACISFFCELTDGRVAELDACHAPE